MPEQSLEARILWHSPRWLSFLKWPSAHEVDFGDFIAEFDFKMNVVRLRYSDGRVREVASFPAQQGRASVSTIKGLIECGQHSVEFIQPDGESSSKLLITEVGEQPALDICRTMENGEYVYAEKFRIIPSVNGRDAYLKVQYNDNSMHLSVISASLLVFNRFAAN